MAKAYPDVASGRQQDNGFLNKQGSVDLERAFTDRPFLHRARLTSWIRG